MHARADVLAKIAAGTAAAVRDRLSARSTGQGHGNDPRSRQRLVSVGRGLHLRARRIGRSKKRTHDNRSASCSRDRSSTVRETAVASCPQDHSSSATLARSSSATTNTQPATDVSRFTTRPNTWNGSRRSCLARTSNRDSALRTFRRRVNSPMPWRGRRSDWEARSERLGTIWPCASPRQPYHSTPVVQRAASPRPPPLRGASRSTSARSSSTRRWTPASILGGRGRTKPFRVPADLRAPHGCHAASTGAANPAQARCREAGDRGSYEGHRCRAVVRFWRCLKLQQGLSRGIRPDADRVPEGPSQFRPSCRARAATYDNRGRSSPTRIRAAPR